MTTCLHEEARSALATPTGLKNKEARLSMSAIHGSGPLAAPASDTPEFPPPAWCHGRLCGIHMSDVTEVDATGPDGEARTILADAAMDGRTGAAWVEMTVDDDRELRLTPAAALAFAAALATNAHLALAVTPTRPQHTSPPIPRQRAA